MTLKQTCPECNLIFEAQPAAGVLACPLCNTVFSPVAPVVPAPIQPAVLAPATAASGRQVLRGVLAVGALLFLAGGLVYAYHLMVGIGRQPAAVSAASAPHTPEPPPLIDAVPVLPATSPSATLRQPRSSSRPPDLQPIARAEEPRRPMTLEERVNNAIDRGLAWLRLKYNDHPQYQNYLGLLGLTLLECGVVADDPSVRQIAAHIRARDRQMTQTYELTLAILFLDRLGDPRDHALIHNFGQRLVVGQLACGAWTYSCLVNDAKRFQPPIPLLVPWTGMPAHKHSNRVHRIAYRGDNSNTQFAILGLWVAQRHGVSAHSALLATARYFRDTQLSDGSWSYHPYAQNWRDSMTCAGLMSLAMRYGVIHAQGRDIRPQQPIFVHDSAIQQGRRYLAQALDKISVADNRIIGVEARDPLYFLWSLERMAVIYGLKKIGDREWYPWAAQMIVEAQKRNGLWPGGPGPVGTCFALLILKRSNFAKDLQLAVQEPPVRPMPAMDGPIILQGRDAILGLTGKPRSPAVMPGTARDSGSSPLLGPSIAQPPKDAGKKTEKPVGVLELPSKK